MALEKEEGGTVTFRIEGVRRRDVHVPPFAGLGQVVGGRRGGGGVAFAEDARARSSCAVEDGSSGIILVSVDGVVRDASHEAGEQGKVGRVPYI